MRVRQPAGGPSRSLVPRECTGCPRPHRDLLGYREYSEADLARIRLVTGARRLGCSLEEIKSIVAIHDECSGASAPIVALLDDKVREVGREVERLEQVLGELRRLQDIGRIHMEAEGVSAD